MKKLKQIVLGIAAVGTLATAASCGSGNGAPVELKMNFKSGDKYLYTTEINQNIGMGQNLGMDQNITMEMLYNCTGGDNNGNKNLQITYQRILMEVKSPMGNMKYDSKEPSAGPDMTGLGIMDSLIGKSFGLEVAPDGSIKKVSGLEDILASFTQNGETAPGIKSQLSDTAIRMMMQNSFDMYPGHAVKVGETWTKKMQMAFSGVQVNVDNTYSLKSVEGDKATLSVASVLNLPVTEMGGATENSQMELSGKQDGTIEVDIPSGQVLSSKVNSDIKGKMTMGGAPQDVKIKGVISVTSKKQ